MAFSKLTNPVAIALLLLLLTAACQSDDPDNGRSDADNAATRGDGAAGASTWMKRSCELPVRYLELIRRGDFPGRSPDIAVVPAAPNFFGSFAVTSHSGPWRYLQKVPLAFYGPGFIRSQGEISLDREVTVADLAPTLAELLDLEWPDDRGGRPLEGVLVPREERTGRPRMILVVVWDGGGWNVLTRWPGAWPRLRKVMKEGTSVAGTSVGSSPSVTPAIHATIGTGAFPREHGIVDLSRRDGKEVVGSFAEERPDDMELMTLADIFDPSTGNEAKVGMLAERNWHMGMVGGGSSIEGGDKDILVLGEAGKEYYSNGDFYRFPKYITDVPGLAEDVRRVDLEDGRLDGSWAGHPILNEPEKFRQTPVSTLYQTRVLKRLFNREGFGTDDIPDLFYTNYKQPDLAGHIFNMVNPEMRSSLRFADEQFAELKAWLDKRVGEGNYVLAFTADHGMGPDPRTVGAWPIDIEELMTDAAKHFGVKQSAIFQKQRITGFWLNRKAMTNNGISIGQVADFFIRYKLRHNATKTVPSQYSDRLDERLFAGAFPSNRLDDVMECARGDGGNN
jgi:hypothetical protein